ncbi:SpvB/TcaC N-terminal domain-containing protein [Sorangium sp. So ce134]
MPKGGGALRGIGEKFSTNPATGTGSLRVPIAVSPGRPGFELGIELGYDSGAGNGPFGIGWRLSTPSITRKSDKGLPRYGDGAEPDVFVLSGSEDLVPRTDEVVPDRDGHQIQRYRPRTEGAFARVERWTKRATGDSHWRVITRDNVLNIYGRSPDAQIADPERPDRVFSWLLEETRDDRGNIARYTYKREDASGVDPAMASEANRFEVAGGSRELLATAQRYLKRIQYNNRAPLLDREALAPADPDDWRVEVVFDYGEHDGVTPTPVESRPWWVRSDPFSSYRATFEVRTYRLCRRVLVFHRFPELGGTPCLVRSTDFTYDEGPVVSYLTGVTQVGYERPPGASTYERATMPPLELGYIKPEVHDELGAIAAESLEGITSGVDGDAAQWVDLDGEGIPGVLIPAERAWLYKANLGEGKLAPPVVQRSLPASAELGRGALLMDLGGDGDLDLVCRSPPLAGYFERTPEGGWAPFVALGSEPNVDWSDPNLRFVDVDGDGLADVLVAEHEAFVWHRSRAKEGFEPAMFAPKPRDERVGAAVVFADGAESIHLADMSGDGLLDIVRVRSGEVCYWPNLGYGRFGRKVTLDGSPRFDTPDQFDPRRVRFADVDGSGTSDILYLGRDGVRLYFNQSGNALASERLLRSIPVIDSGSTLDVVDLFGRGTACVVVSDPSSPGRPLACAEILGWRRDDGTIEREKKPHLLESIVNNMGVETRISYASSTKFYLLDKRAGVRWATRLPFPVHVVERIERIDHVARASLLTRYRYRHGYFDGVEREFRGFVRVDQWDEEAFGDERPPVAGAPLDPASVLRQPPTRTTTWFHTGAWLGPDLREAMRAEFWSQDPSGAFLQGAPPLPGDTPREQREAARALRGDVLRQEIYAEDGTERAQHPYSVLERRSEVRLLQSAVGPHPAVFLVQPGEAYEVYYERAPDDPRVLHDVTLAVDDFGNVLESARIGYPRRLRDASIAGRFRASQEATLVSYTVKRFTGPVKEDAAYRAPLPAESRIYELTGARRAGLYFSAKELKDAFGKARPIDYGETPAGGEEERRRVQHERTLYRTDDLTGVLALEAVEPRALVAETYRLALTDKLLSQVFRRQGRELLPAADRARALEQDGGYRRRSELVAQGLFPGVDPLGDDKDDDYWTPSGRVYLSERHSGALELAEAEKGFLLPRRVEDPWGNRSFVRYAYDLIVSETEDLLGNRFVASEIDYRVLQPKEVTDPNGNREAVRFDALGVVIAMARSGKNGEGDRLAGISEQRADVEAFFAAPTDVAAAVLLGEATIRFVYDAFAFQRTKGASPAPVVVAVLARETHAADLAPGASTAIRKSLVYFDGFERAVQTKVEVEPGPLVPGGGDHAPRWVGSGWTILDNKGFAVRTYEPFFSAAHAFEFARREGVGATVLRDPIGRVVGTLFPDHTFEKVVFGAWAEEHWDQNDTSTTAPEADPYIGGRIARLPRAERWPAWPDHAAPGDRSPEEGRAAEKAAVHAGTPRRRILDVLGRPVLSVAHNRYRDEQGALVDELLPTFTELDIEGLERAVVDAKRRQTTTSLATLHDEGRVVMRRSYDALGRLVFQVCMDAGERWLLPDAAGNPLRSWDRVGRSFRVEYDTLRRPAKWFVRGHDPAHPTVEIEHQRVTYGEEVTSLPPAARNLRGRVYEERDAAGVLRYEYDFKGNRLRVVRELAVDFKGPLDWSTNPALEAGHAQAFRYDAGDRVIEIIARDEGQEPAKSRVLPSYNGRGLLDSVRVGVRGQAPAVQIEAMTYDAQGRRLSCRLQNGVVSAYTYDPKTFRLASITTRRANGDLVQRLLYTYDAVGNVTSLRDLAQQTIHFNGEAADASAEYTYDALYQLRRATGREHEGQLADPGPDDIGRVGLPHPHDWQKMRRYVESYDYDEVGNLLALVHRANRGDFNRVYQYNRPSRIDGGRLGNALTETVVGQTKAQYTYDEHGNMASMGDLPSMAWDHQDRLAATARQVVRAGTPETTYYVYDARGERVRKLTCAQGTGHKIKERIYLGGFEIYRELDGGGAVALERETLHVTDGDRRVAIVDTRADDQSRPLVRYQLGDHLGSVRVELDDSRQANVISYEEYHPYGSTSFQARGSQTYARKRYRYTGKERDEESGLYHHGARYYAPWLGRWISPDAAGLVDGPQRYGYVRNRPLNNADPSGRAAEDRTLHPAQVEAGEIARQRYGQYLAQGEALGLSRLQAGTLADGAMKVEYDSVWSGTFADHKHGPGGAGPTDTDVFLSGTRTELEFKASQDAERAGQDYNGRKNAQYHGNSRLQVTEGGVEAKYVGRELSEREVANLEKVNQEMKSRPLMDLREAAELQRQGGKGVQGRVLGALRKATAAAVAARSAAKAPAPEPAAPSSTRGTSSNQRSTVGGVAGRLSSTLGVLGVIAQVKDVVVGLWSGTVPLQGGRVFILDPSRATQSGALKEGEMFLDESGRDAFIRENKIYHVGGAPGGT